MSVEVRKLGKLFKQQEKMLTDDIDDYMNRINFRCLKFDDPFLTFALFILVD